MHAAQAIGQQKPMESIVLKAGTIVKVGGFPFKLLVDTPVDGHHANLGLAGVGMGVGQVLAQGGGSAG